MYPKDAVDYIENLREYPYEYAIEQVKSDQKSRDEWIDILLYLNSIEMNAAFSDKSHDNWPKHDDVIDSLKRVIIDTIKRINDKEIEGKSLWDKL